MVLDRGRRRDRQGVIGTAKLGPSLTFQALMILFSRDNSLLPGRCHAPLALAVTSLTLIIPSSWSQKRWS
jgi:hypothetical protein